MIIKRFTVLITVLLLGSSVNPSLDNLRALNGGAIVDFNIAQFDDAPVPRASSIADLPDVNPGIGKYEFSVEEVIFRESEFLANGKQAPSLKLVAKNRGYAPVSVTITYDRCLSENIPATLPHPIPRSFPRGRQ
jgi:hypothetical protein